jgi:hypothetical protein
MVTSRRPASLTSRAAASKLFSTARMGPAKVGIRHDLVQAELPPAIGTSTTTE